MRSTHFGFGILAAAGLLSTTAAHGQVQQAVDIGSGRPSSVTTIGVDIRDEPAILAGAADPFSVGRKTQDVNYGASNSASSSNSGSSSGDNSRSANNSVPPSNVSNRAESINPSVQSKQSASRESSVQSVFPNSSGSMPQNASSGAASSSVDSDATTTGPLKNLQQRLSAARKSTTPGMMATPNPSSSAIETSSKQDSVPSLAAAPVTSIQPALDMTSTPIIAPSLAPTSIMSHSTSPTAASGTGRTLTPVMSGFTPTTPAKTLEPASAVASDSSSDAAPTAAPTPPTSIAATDVLDSPNEQDSHINQFSNANTDVFRTKNPAARASAPVVSVAALPTVSAAGSVNPARRNYSLAPAPNFNNSSPCSAIATAAPTRGSVSTSENVLFSHQSPILEVETSGPRSICVGKEANYTITISNAGELPAQNVEVSIKTPEASEVLRTKASNGEVVGSSNKRGEPLVWRMPRLESHAKEQLTVRLVPRESQSFDLVVQWSCSPAMSKAMVEVKEPKIALTLDGPSELLFGQTKVYRLTLANPGNGDAENVVLLLAPVDGGAGAPTRHEIGLIRAGETKPVEVELSARQAGKLAIKAMAVADGNLKSEVAQDILVRRAGLKANVTGPELKFAGTPVTYNVVVANPGNCTCENISASAILPPGAKFVGSPGAQFVEEENKVTWIIPSLRAGAEQELQLTCTLNSPGTNRVQVLATAAGDLNDNISTVTNVEALADLKLEVADPPGPLAVGEEMIYEVHIRNRGTKAAENVDVAGFFSTGIEPLNAQGAPNQIAPGQIVFKPIEAIGPGAEVVLRIKARADQPGNHVFRTEVNCPSVGAKLASEETTLFYGDARTAEERIAVRPAMAAQTIPSTDSSAPAVTR